MLVQMWQLPRTLWVYSRQVWQLLTEQREIEKNLKKANSNSRWMCCSIISSCVNFTILVSCHSLYYDLFAAESSGQPVSSAQPFFLMLLLHVFQWTEILQCLIEVLRHFNSNSLGLFGTSEVHSISPMYFASKITPQIFKKVYSVYKNLLGYWNTTLHGQWEILRITNTCLWHLSSSISANQQGALRWF